MKLTVRIGALDGWQLHGPLGGGAVALRAVLVRLLWSALRPVHGVQGMPTGSFEGLLPEVAAIRLSGEQIFC